MDAWTLIRFLHVLGIVFFVGGQLMLVAAIVPVMRAGDPVAMRAVARRFGMGSGIALLVIVATGAAMAGEFSRWDEPALHAKLALLALVAVLLGLHVKRTDTRAISVALLVTSLAIVYLGLELAHG